MALIRSAVGGSIISARRCRSSSIRTCSSRRSSCQMRSTRWEVSLIASVWLHSCQPVSSRISVRCRLAVREVKSYEPSSDARTPACRAMCSTASPGSSARILGNRPRQVMNFSWTAKPSRVAPALFRSQPTSSPTSVKCSTTPSSPRSRPTRRPPLLALYDSRDSPPGVHSFSPTSEPPDGNGDPHQPGESWKCGQAGRAAAVSAAWSCRRAAGRPAWPLSYGSAPSVQWLTACGSTADGITAMADPPETGQADWPSFPVMLSRARKRVMEFFPPGGVGIIGWPRCACG